MNTKLKGCFLSFGLLATMLFATQSLASSQTKNVIFFHPDGFAINHWAAVRTWVAGPDGKINWDRLPYLAPYTGHMKNALTSSSHGGATVHAYGVKVVRDSFGMDGTQEITALSGKNMSIVEEAMKAGFATALVQSGAIYEPGTASFVASTKSRGMRDEIARLVINSDVDVILAGGESWLLPKGVKGRHGKGVREDSLNLIEKAKSLGYTIVYTQDELAKVANDPKVLKVLGVFASKHTFNDNTEEKNREKNLPIYWDWAPTIAEMSEATLKILSRNPKASQKGMFIIAEEEGTDNLANKANAMGTLEAGKRSDVAFGVFLDFVEENPDNTLLITAADSSAAALSIYSPDPKGFKRIIKDGKTGVFGHNSDESGEWVNVPLDGIDGANTAPFKAAADKMGKEWPFVMMGVRGDVSGGILARGIGKNADIISKLGVVDNTDIYRIMYYTLFDKWLAKRR